MTVSLAVSNRCMHPGHIKAAVAVAACTCGAGFIAATNAGIPLGQNGVYLATMGASTFCVYLIVTVLLLIQAKIARDRATAALGAAYFFSAMTLIPHFLAYPVVNESGPLIGASASSLWLWCVWHGGYAACVAWYALIAPAGSLSRGGAAARGVGIWSVLAGSALVVLAATGVVTFGLPWLPVILIDRDYTRLNTLGIGPLVLLCNASACALVTWRLRGRSIISIWVAVAALASSVDVMLTLCAMERFTLGWYVARFFSLTTGLTVLVALLTEITDLFSRTLARNRQLETLALTDSLTEVPNRRAFDHNFDTAWRLAQREKTPLSLLMIDIDLFKGFNDIYGHLAGDDCLRQISVAIQGSIRRPGDSLARIGGEEFAVILPNTDERGTLKIAESVRSAAYRLQLQNRAGIDGRVTVSIGAATSWPGDGAESVALITSADVALYRAKRSGRNQIVSDINVEAASTDTLRKLKFGRGH